MKVTGQNGVWKGMTLYVQDRGGGFYTLGQVLDRKACQARSPLIGYGCSAKDSGDPRPCDSCSD
jgi:hypothetical protein